MMPNGCLECGVEQTKENVGKGWMGIHPDEGYIGSICNPCFAKWEKRTDQEFDARIDQLIEKYLKSARHGMEPQA